MKVILREEVDALGNAGDVVNVKDGYARNFLLPRQLAVRADARNTRQLAHVQRAMLARRARLEDAANAASKELEELARVVFVRSCSGERKLFGSVTTRDIAAALLERSVEVDRRRIVLHEPIKTLGDFDVSIKLGQGVNAGIKVSVEPDETSAELIARAAAQAADAGPAEEAAAETDAE
ncbi:MAG: 50S ribosomal protein L9 [Proteobacteria bacterium]|nr:50S ribosomal protein L9 [Pseudomonadota bacterium]